MPRPDYSVHVLKMFRQFILLPVTVYRWTFRFLSRWCSTADSRRAKDSLRQSRVRRGLRGLTPDHDPVNDAPGVRHASVPTGSGPASKKADPVH